MDHRCHGDVRCAPDVQSLHQGRRRDRGGVQVHQVMDDQSWPVPVTDAHRCVERLVLEVEQLVGVLDNQLDVGTARHEVGDMGDQPGRSEMRRYREAQPPTRYPVGARHGGAHELAERPARRRRQRPAALGHLHRPMGAREQRPAHRPLEIAIAMADGRRRDVQGVGRLLEATEPDGGVERLERQQQGWLETGCRRRGCASLSSRGVETAADFAAMPYCAAALFTCHAAALLAGEARSIVAVLNSFVRLRDRPDHQEHD